MTHHARMLDLVRSYAKAERNPLRIESRLTTNAQTQEAEGELLIYGPILSFPWFEEETSAFTFRSAVNRLNLPDGARLNIRVNSPGGVVDEAVAIFNTMRQLSERLDVHAYVDGLAASAASLVICAADVVHMPPNARIMIHNAWTYASGDSSDLRAAADYLDDANRQVIASYRTRVELSEETLVAMMNAETWIDAETALEQGWIDEIVGAEASAEALAWNLEPFGYEHAPNLPRAAARLAGAVSRASAAPRPSSEGTPNPSPDAGQENEPMEAKAILAALAGDASLRDAVFAEIAEEDTLREGIVAALPSEPVDGLIDIAVNEERDRIVAILDVPAPGQAELVRKAIADPKGDAGSLALSVLEAERGTREARAAAMDADAPEPLDAAAGSPDPSAETATDFSQIEDLEERAEAMWNANAVFDGRHAQDFHGGKEAFAAYMKAAERGAITARARGQRSRAA